MREVRTLWFRPLSWWEIPFFTIPFVGDVPFRRLAYIVLFGVAGWFMGAYVSGVYGGLAGASAGFFVGFLLGSPNDFLPPELVLLHVFSSPSSIREGTEHRVVEPAPVTVSVPGVGEPVKVFGFVRDAEGRALANAEVLLLVDGRPEAKALTDWDGGFVFYSQLTPGEHEVVVRHGDAEVLKSLVRVEVRGS